MITFLTSPKPCFGETYNNQIRAIQSWLAIEKDAEVVLYGNSEGTQKISNALNVKYISDIETNEFGTPLFNAIANHATQYAKYDLQAYINCDIILTQEFLDAAKCIPFPQFLMIGQRLDINAGCFIDVQAEDWHKKLIEFTQLQQVSLHPPAGSDYFLFRRGLWKNLPPIAIGRGGYDNALIMYCLERDMPVVDATFKVLALHPLHEYLHINGGEHELFCGIEARRNLSYWPNSKGLILTLGDATWRISGTKLKRSYARGDWLRAIETRALFYNKSNRLIYLIRQLKRVGHYLGISKAKVISINDILEKINK